MNRLFGVSILIALIIAGRVTAQQSTQSGDRSRAITGRVFNHNGQPLAGSKVLLEKVGSGQRNNHETFTDEAGEFRFDNLSHGIYLIFAVGAPDANQVQKLYRPGDSVTFRAKKGGVITGTVTDSAGEPMITARVRVTRVRDEQGRRIYQASPFSQWQRDRLTDDRGIYRLWGLVPGSYLVSVGGKNRANENRAPYTAYDGAPTYHPSAATPESATEVNLQDGQEVAGVDIRYRSESGHAISGYISGLVASSSQEAGGVVMLTQAATDAMVDWKGIRATEGSSSFVFDGLADGEYDLTALRVVSAVPPDIDAASPRRRVIIKSKDVSGIEMKLAPLGSIDGRLVLETNPKPRCQSKNNARPDETLIIANVEGVDPPLPNLTFPALNVRGAPVAPDQKGNFTFRSLRAAQYHIEAQLLSEDWYIRAINLPGPTPSRPIDAGREGINLKSGQRVTGLTISIQEGAAYLRGRVSAALEGSALPARLRVHLVPAERQQSDNVLRFTEAAVQSDGSFLLTNIAPGRYWLLARPADELRNDSMPPLAWDMEARAKLVRAAVAADHAIELLPCQRISDHVLRYDSLVKSDLKKNVIYMTANKQRASK
ncbi:MAG: carboxypeptidase-like regulatory domain-containing protein [Blastocatellia bacterium]